MLLLLYLTSTLYVYINATLVCHGLNTGEELPEVITKTTSLAHYESLSFPIVRVLGPDVAQVFLARKRARELVL
jgi:hypothetical protein